MNGEKELRLNPPSDKSVLTIILGIGMEGGIMQLVAALYFAALLLCLESYFFVPKNPKSRRY